MRYLKTLHGMFAGDWRLAVMAYNAGEYRVLGALKRSGQVARNANPEQLVGLSDITQAYVRKLHALSCLMEQADDREEWLRSLDRPVPHLQAVTLPAEIKRLDQWASRTGQDSGQLKRLNPVFADGIGARPARLLATAAPACFDRRARVDSAAGWLAATPTADAITPAHRPSRRERLDHRPPLRRACRRPAAAQRPRPRRAVLKPGQLLVIDPLDSQANRVPGEAGSP